MKLTLMRPILVFSIIAMLMGPLFTSAQKNNTTPLPAAKAVKVKVALVIQDPVVSTGENKKMHEVYTTPGYTFKWHDPMELAQAYLDTLNAVSGGAVQYEIVKVYDDSLFFTRLGKEKELLSKRRIEELLAEPGWATFKKEGTKFDYNRFLEHYGFCEMRDKGIINEVWLWTFPYGGTWESTFAGEGAFWLNSNPVEGTSCKELLTVMGLNYEREMSLALESYGHRIESIMRKVYGRWDNKASDRNTWEIFTTIDKVVPGRAHIGNIHFPPNGTSDYNWINKNKVNTYADSWYNYPNIAETNGRIVDCTEWKCTHLGYMTWWMRHMPHYEGINPADGHLNNWWHYVVDYNAAVKLENKMRKKAGK